MSLRCSQCSDASFRTCATDSLSVVEITAGMKVKDTPYTFFSPHKTGELNKACSCNGRPLPRRERGGGCGGEDASIGSIFPSGSRTSHGIRQTINLIDSGSASQYGRMEFSTSVRTILLHIKSLRLQAGRNSAKSGNGVISSDSDSDMDDAHGTWIQDSIGRSSQNRPTTVVGFRLAREGAFCQEHGVAKSKQFPAILSLVSK